MSFEFDENRHQQATSCCARCFDEYVAALPADAPFSLRFCHGMFLCPTCGNKRCPTASDHRQGCTGSNDPGQPGSRYAAPPAS